MKKEDLIQAKINEGWEDKVEDFGLGSRRWYLKKGQFDVTYNRYGNYKSPSVHELNNTFKAISDYENNDVEAIKIVNKYVDVTDLSEIHSESYYVSKLQLTAQDLIIDKKSVAEL